jgi:tRNA1(Val) A37 N6-methylase TrmN6
LTATYKTERLGERLYLATSEEHTFGSDAFLLAEFAGERLRHKDRAVDLGTGCGIIAFLLYKNRRPQEMWGVDIQPQAIDQFQASLDYSAEQGEPFDGILRPVCSDLKELRGKLPLGTFDLVTCNPPYKTAGTGILSAETAHQIARHEVLCSIDDVCAAAASLLKTGGRLCICQRPERLCDIMLAMRSHRIEPKRLQFVAKDDHTAPWLLLIEGKKDAKPYMDVLPTLIFDRETAARITHYGE